MKRLSVNVYLHGELRHITSCVVEFLGDILMRLPWAAGVTPGQTHQNKTRRQKWIPRISADGWRAAVRRTAKREEAHTARGNTLTLHRNPQNPRSLSTCKHRFAVLIRLPWERLAWGTRAARIPAGRWRASPQERPYAFSAHPRGTHRRTIYQESDGTYAIHGACAASKVEKQRQSKESP